MGTNQCLALPDVVPRDALHKVEHGFEAKSQNTLVFDHGPCSQVVHGFFALLDRITMLSDKVATDLGDMLLEAIQGRMNITRDLQPRSTKKWPHEFAGRLLYMATVLQVQ